MQDMQREKKVEKNKAAKMKTALGDVTNKIRKAEREHGDTTVGRRC